MTLDLPILAYDYSALEPHLSGEILEIHHSQHHAKLVVGANKALEQLSGFTSGTDPVQAVAHARALAFCLSGHVLHSVYWQSMSPQGGGPPSGILGDAITQEFGSYNQFRAQLTATATSILGSGWAALSWDRVRRKLVIESICELADSREPLLVIDVWEHAYYLQYRNAKSDYLEAFWAIVDWGSVAGRLCGASGFARG